MNDLFLLVLPVEPYLFFISFVNWRSIATVICCGGLPETDPQLEAGPGVSITTDVLLTILGEGEWYRPFIYGVAGTLASASVETDVIEVFERLASGLKLLIRRGNQKKKRESKHTKHQSLPMTPDVLVTSAHSYWEPDSNSSGTFGW